jgi:hypothetical protein
MRVAAKSTFGDTFTDRSGTITIGGVSQSLAPDRKDRTYLFFQNLSGSELWVNFGAAPIASAAAGSIRVPAYAAFSLEGNFVSTEAIAIFGAITGQAFTCKENSPV